MFKAKGRQSTTKRTRIYNDLTRWKCHPERRKQKKDKITVVFVVTYFSNVHTKRSLNIRANFRRIVGIGRVQTHELMGEDQEEEEEVGDGRKKK